MSPPGLEVISADPLGDVPLLDVAGLAVGYGGEPVLRDVDLVRGPGVIGVVGANGAGKTTLLRGLAGILEPTHGSVRIGGGPAAASALVGYLPHDVALPPRLRTWQYLDFWLEVVGIRRSERRALAQEALERLGVGDLADRRCKTLSRGQAQRVALARVVSHRPRVIILDEPTTGLDPVAREEFIGLIEDIAATDVLVVVSTHQLDELRRLTDDVVLVRGGLVVPATTDGDAARPATAALAAVALRFRGGSAAVDQALEVAAGEGWAARRLGAECFVDLPAEVSLGRLMSTFEAHGLVVTAVRGDELETLQAYRTTADDEAAGGTDPHWRKDVS